LKTNTLVGGHSKQYSQKLD